MAPQQGDAGGSLTEYVAVVVLVSAAVAAVLLLALPNPVAEGVQRAICMALDLDDCGTDPDDVADEDYEPERCLQTRLTDVSGYQVEVVLTLGEEFSFITETYSNGETRLTLVDNSTLEASLGAGAGVNVGKVFQLGAEISVGGGVSLPNGSTWVFDDPEEAAGFADDLRTQQKIELTKSVSPIIGWGVEQIWGPDLPEPDITRQAVETTVSAQAMAGLKLGRDRDDEAEGGPSTGGIDGWTVNPKLLVEGGVGVKSVLGQSSDSRDGSTITTYELGGTAHINANWVVDKRKPAVGRTGTMSVVQDEDGGITRLILSQTQATGLTSTVTTTSVTVGTPEEQAMVEDWLGLVADDQVIPLTWDSMAPTELGDDPSPFERWLFDNGRTSRVHYDNENNVYDVSAGAKLGVSLGLGGTWGGESMAVNGAEYLGAPSDGVREYVPYDTCA